MVMGKNGPSVEVGGETDPTHLADEVKNQNKQLTFFCLTFTVVCVEICVFLSSIFLNILFKKCILYELLAVIFLHETPDITFFFKVAPLLNSTHFSVIGPHGGAK
jgi:hypothetical protein